MPYQPGDAITNSPEDYLRGLSDAQILGLREAYPLAGNDGLGRLIDAEGRRRGLW